jgi:hypothetical protein
MSSDRSRNCDDLIHQYKAVVAQQGRVILDRDLNALQETVSSRIEADALNVFGPSGTPDDGFAISFPDSSPPSPPLWSPPSPLSPPTHQEYDFLVSPGTMYVGGQRASLPATEAGQPITYSYFDQPDWPQPTPPKLPQFRLTPEPIRILGPALSVLRPTPILPPIFIADVESICLHLFEQEVGAVEDPDLLEVALGGPDTMQRVRLMRRIERKTVLGTDCASAWSEVIADWLTQGLTFDSKTMRLLPQVKLQVSFTQTQVIANPCDPVASGGYLGAENQLIRVQISDPGVPGSPGQPAKLLWGYDNASFMYRVTAVVANATQLQLHQDPPDAFHIPQTGQAVEILRSAAILGSVPDESDPTGQRTIVRCVAEATGVVRTLTQPYGPVNSNDPTNYIVFDQSLPPEYANDPNPLFLRVWEAELSFTAGDPIALAGPTNPAATGIQVTISLPQSGVLTLGAFWMITVRPSTPQAVYPERLLAGPQPPDGPRQWVCPLAVIEWKGFSSGIVHNCRNAFGPLGPPLLSPAMHVTGMNWANDDVLLLPAFLKGLQLTFDFTPDSQSVTSATMIVSIEAPKDVYTKVERTPLLGILITQIADFTELTLVGTISSSGNSIVWQPPQNADFFAPFFQDATVSIPQVRIRVVLRGHKIWSDSGQLLYLDGQTFGKPGTQANTSNSRIDLNLPSGNGVRASDFESWFWLQLPLPTVTGLSPSSGPIGGGTSVNIFGSSFIGVTSVSFGGIPAASFQVLNDTSMSATSPKSPQTTGSTVDLTVTTPGGTSQIVPADQFTWTPPIPVVTGISPNQAVVGGSSAVVITGSGFTNAQAVKFGPTSAISFTVVNDTTINANSPTISPTQGGDPFLGGVVDVTVTTPAGTSLKVPADQFTWIRRD